MQVRQQLAILCRHHYWERALITQEVIESRAPRMLYKEWGVDWKVFVEVLTLSQTARDNPEHTNTIMRLRTLSVEQRAFDNLPGNHHPVSQSIWQLLTWRESALSTDLCDRTYSVFSLTNIDGGFQADYTESTVDLFWRAGEHFKAWSQPRFIITLMQALNIDTIDLERSLRRRPDRMISLPLRRVILARTSLGIGRKAYCSWQSCKAYKGIPVKSSRDLTTCTPFLDIDNFDCSCVHIHVSSARDFRDSRELKFQIPRLQHRVKLAFQARGARSCMPLALDSLQQRGTNEGPFASMDRVYIKDHLTTDNIYQWKLQIPAKVVVSLLEDMRS